MGNVALSNHSHFSSETRSARHAAWKSWRAFRLFNPGAFQDLHQKSEDVFPVKMDGVRLILNKDISFHLKQASHAIVLGVPGQSGYHFGATYFGEGETKNGEALPWFVADIDGAGSLSARAEGQFGKNGRARLVLQTHEEKFETWQGTLEKRGRDHTISLTVGNPNVIEGTGVAVLHFLQTISPCLSLGGEMVYHRQGNSEGAFVTAAARYSGQDCVAAMNIGHGGFHASYFHQATSQHTNSSYPGKMPSLEAAWTVLGELGVCWKNVYVLYQSPCLLVLSSITPYRNLLVASPSPSIDHFYIACFLDHCSLVAWFRLERSLVV
uniref:mitochondrial import receptor subunit TOM40 homolog isoform X3 n=1 Tax=Myxine glutinosa TaxID=7769 RepID=UPI00358F16EA